jgi:hypothetical protein
MSVTTTSGARRLGRREQRIEIPADGNHLELVPRLEQALEALADEKIVLCEDDADRHGPRIGAFRRRDRNG